MDGVIPGLLIAGVIAIIIVAVVYGSIQAKKRREALAALAAELGWNFSPQKDTSHDDEYAHFEIFRKGHSRCAYNTLTGDTEINGITHAIKMGDFLYKVTSSNGKTTTTTTYRFSYLIAHLPATSIPALLIRREGLFDKMASAFGFDDIDFESEEFSRKFFVKSSDKRMAYDIINPRMMEFLMAGEAPMVDIENGRCLLSDGQSCWNATQFRQQLEWFGRFMELWPEHLRVELGMNG